MPTTRKPLRRNLRRRLTPAAIDAWKAADFIALHRALGLHPWEASPLPDTIISLGVSEEKVAEADPNSNRFFVRSYPQALELQRELLAVAGWPNCRREYEKNLVAAEEMADYYEDQLQHPELRHKGTGSDTESVRASLEDALEEVAYRQKLLDDLGPG